MKRLLRVSGLAIALTLISLATASAWPEYDRCYYSCDDGVHEGYTDYGTCCGGGLRCPNGSYSSGISWGGGYGSQNIEVLCN